MTIDNLVGHRFPSGVGFRRAFLELAVLDGAGEVLWASGRTDGAGVLVDEQGQADRRRDAVAETTAPRASPAPPTSRTTR